MKWTRLAALTFVVSFFAHVVLNSINSFQNHKMPLQTLFKAGFNKLVQCTV
jgi:hypothetical protein